MLVVKVPFRDKVRMVLASAVGADMTVAIGASMIVATLA
jgi:hypothetical protein